MARYWCRASGFGRSPIAGFAFQLFALGVFDPGVIRVLHGGIGLHGGFGGSEEVASGMVDGAGALAPFGLGLGLGVLGAYAAYPYPYYYGYPYGCYGPYYGWRSVRRLPAEPGALPGKGELAMSDLEKLTYRVCKHETGWQWRVLGPDQTVLVEGFADESFKARAQAILLALDLSGRKRNPEDCHPGLVPD